MSPMPGGQRCQIPHQRPSRAGPSAGCRALWAFTRVSAMKTLALSPVFTLWAVDSRHMMTGGGHGWEGAAGKAGVNSQS